MRRKSSPEGIPIVQTVLPGIQRGRLSDPNLQGP